MSRYVVTDKIREPLELPNGYYATIKGSLVSIYHEGHKGELMSDEPELILQSNNLQDRRPSIWIDSDLTDGEKKVLEDALWNGWEKMWAI